MFSQHASSRLLHFPAQPQAPRLSALLQTRGLVQISGLGSATVALHRCLEALREGGAAGWIAPKLDFYPLGSLEAGAMDRLLTVRVSDGKSALKAADLLLACPGAAQVVAVTLPAKFRPPPAHLLRLQRLVEKSDSTLLFLDDGPLDAPSIGPAVVARVHVRPAPSWSLHLTVTRNKSGPEGPLTERLPHGPDRLRAHRSL